MYRDNASWNIKDHSLTEADGLGIVRACLLSIPCSLVDSRGCIIMAILRPLVRMLREPKRVSTICHLLGNSYRQLLSTFSASGRCTLRKIDVFDELRSGKLPNFKGISTSLITEIGNEISGKSSATGQQDNCMSGSDQDTRAAVGRSQFHKGGAHGGHLYGRCWKSRTVLPSRRHTSIDRHTARDRPRMEYVPSRHTGSGNTTQLGDVFPTVYDRFQVVSPTRGTLTVVSDSHQGT